MRRPAKSVCGPVPQHRSDRPIRRLLPKTLFRRALLIIVTPLVLMHGISTFVFFDRHLDNVTQRLTEALAGDIAFVIHTLGPLHAPDRLAATADPVRQSMRMNIAFEPGRSLEKPFQAPEFDFVKIGLAKALGERVGRPFDIDTETVSRHVLISIEMPDGVLSVNVHRKRLYSSTPYIFLMWTVGSSLILFAIAVIFLRNQLRPVRRLAIAARNFGMGREVSDFRLEGASEVRQAAEAFRQMRQRINRQFVQRTEMLAGVSHDLRTPLTRMKLQLAMLDDSEEIELLKGDVNDMERMVEGYLAFARGEGIEVSVEIDLRDLLDDVVTTERRDGSTITFRTTGACSARILGRPQAFKRAVANLIVNAKKYAETTAVCLETGPHAVTVTVDDDGPGISAEHREDVFKPFFRLDPSRNPTTGGTGLGLAIARDIISSHGGELELADSALGGLQARITMPI